MTTQAQVRVLGEFARWGFSLKRPDDHFAELYHQGEFIAQFTQMGSIEQILQAMCARHLVIKHGWDGCLWSRRNEGEGA